MIRELAYISRIWARIEQQDDGCWTWTGPIHRTGYAHVWVGYGEHGRQKVYLHRWVYEQIVGPIPDGLQIDHLCRVRHCVNPAHLEPVTPSVNVRRSTAPSARLAAATHCVHGHPLSGPNLYIRTNGNRTCRTCQRACGRAHRKRLREAAAA